MPRRKVLFICHNHPKVRPGGAEAYAHELHLAMRDSAGWAPTFLARSGPPQSRHSRPPGGPRIVPVDGTEDEYFLYPDGYDYDWLFGTMQLDKSLYTRHLRDFLRALEPDVVHFQHTLFVGYDALREVRRTLPHVPIVYTLHEFLPICHAKGQMVRTMDGSLCDEETPRRCSECFPDVAPQAFFLRKRFIQAQLALVDLFIAPSELLRERFAEWGLPRERIMVEDYGRRRSPDGPAASREPHDTFGFFGQLNPYKGIDVLLDAVAELAHTADGRALPRVHVHGANLDVQERRFRERVAARLDGSCDVVTSFGPYAPEAAGELMRAVDWVVVPSTWWENSPLVIQEAFANGRPVICSDIGGMAEKVGHDRDGLHFRVGDARSLADTIRFAMDTPGLWERLANGIRPVRSMADHLAVLEAEYDRLIAARHHQAVPA